ncbi:ABC transporter ATP-binding protein [Clostridium sp. CCUG 7971]|uniref:ABC transporter ATP-binding protein n=1 Tax=Clostridium sp. CCUG 7971 TaxID=2811414 RepID=UPI001ABBAF0B|nr:ABC transporter ATP-binding protein [Clostridium sp. CCUG 7971]MBO3446003.1 ABC transporter ATP-binding protein [Clostridium sp. CCUG 7971]
MNPKSNSRKMGPGGPGGPMGAMAGVSKAKDFKGTMKKLIQHLKPYKIAMVLVVIFAIGSAAFNIVGPKILGNATTAIFEGLVNKISGSGNGIDFGYIGRILSMLVGLYVISALFSFVQTFVTSDISQKVSYNLRKEISEKINKLPLNYFDKTTNGEVLSRVTNDVDAISQNLNQVLSQMITAATTIIGVLIMMLSISVSMTIASLVIIPLSLIFIMLVVKKSQKYFKEQQEYLGSTNGHVEEIYSGHNIMKAFNGEEKAINEFEDINEKLYNSAWKSQFLSGMMMPIMTFIGNLGYVIVAIMGGYLAIKKTIQVGDILSFIQYTRSFMQPIAQTAQISNVMQATAAAAERVFEFLEEEEEAKDTTNPLSTENVKGEVEFKDVHFGYDEDKIIINDFSAKIKPGQKVAIVGPTGAGKTTVVKLLMRFYELNSGKILVDGHDIKDFTRNDLRDMFGMVLQDTWLFNGSMMENIRYGRLEATDKEVIEASKLAHADHFIKTLSEGYKTEVNEEANNISQGQKQLLTIARAILSDPKILILDEATSSVDTRTEVLIQQAMENLMKGRTSFIIAHRLSTIRNADIILVMKDGDIIEQGSHEELLKAKGFYYDLYNSQFEEGEAS